MTLPTWGHTVLGSSRGPLIIEGVRDGQPMAIFAFDPVASGFEKSIGFLRCAWLILCRPHWLASQVHVFDPGRRSRPPGAPPMVGQAVVVRPDGQRGIPASAGPGTRFDRTDQIGRYSVQDASTQRTTRQFSVSILNSPANPTRRRDRLQIHRLVRLLKRVFNGSAPNGGGRCWRSGIGLSDAGVARLCEAWMTWPDIPIPSNIAFQQPQILFLLLLVPLIWQIAPGPVFEAFRPASGAPP